jgi:DNA-binding CsgD family transcriptional regulator
MDMSTLTQREREVVNLLAQGKTQSTIARQLVISRHTVYAHVRNIREKTGAASAFELAVSAVRQSQRT